MRTRVDAMAALEAAPHRIGKMAVNMRAGQVLVLHPDGFGPITIEFEAKHGNGGRLVVRAPINCKITPPATEPA